MLCLFECIGNDTGNKAESNENSGGGTFQGSVLSGETKNILIITKEDIEKKQYKTITEVFEDSPLTVVTHTPTGPMIAIRGSGEKTMTRVKVLLDGTSITSLEEQMGSIPFNAIPVDFIEKIEIVPGGGITLYGTGSADGVINIVTKSASLVEYGKINIGGSSDGHSQANIGIAKGIKITDKFFVNIGAELSGGKEYREHEKFQRRNLNTSLNYIFNEKHRVKLKTEIFKENVDSSNELTLKNLSRNRRGAGVSLANLKSDRQSFSLDYEYQPSEEFQISTTVNKTRYHRNIFQDNRPKISPFHFPGTSESVFNSVIGYHDTVAKDVYNELHGSFEEDVANARLKGEYKYNHGKGKLIFGYDYTDHNVKREMNIQAKKFSLYDQVGYIQRDKNQRVDEDFYEENADNFISITSLFTNHATGLRLLNAHYVSMSPYYFKEQYLLPKEDIERYIFLQPEMDRLYQEETKVVNEEALRRGISKEENYDEWFKIWTVYAKPYAEERTLLQEEKRILEYKNLKNLLSFDVTYEELFKNPEEVNIKERLEQEMQLSKMLGGEEIQVPIEKLMKMKVSEIAKLVYDATYKDFDKSTIISSKVNSYADLNKKTHSLYLFNEYNINNKFSWDAGIRWEYADYSGERGTEVYQEFYRDKTEEVPFKNLQDFLIASLWESSYEYMNSKLTAMESAAKRKEWEANLRKNGYNSFLMSKRFTKVKEQISNFGGEIGFKYRYGNFGKIFIKYQRAFNSPTPAQLTNKVYSQTYKVNAYEPSRVKSEIIDSLDIGISDTLGKNTIYSLSFFGNVTNNEITMMSRDGNSHMYRKWIYANIAKTRRLGLELQLKHVFGKLTLKESITLVDARIRKNSQKPNPNALDTYLTYDYNMKKGDRIPLSSKVKGTLGLDYEFNSKLKLGANYTYSGSYVTKEPGNETKIISKKVKGHGVLDLYANYYFNEYLSFRFGINNVLNEVYNLREDSRSATPAPGITYNAGFSYRF